MAAPSPRAWQGITALANSPDGTLIASASDRDNKIRLWDATSGQQRLILQDHLRSTVTGVAFSADGTRLVSVGRDSEVRSWDVVSGTQLQTLRALEHPGRTVAVSPDGRFVASAGEETRIILWNAADGTLSNILYGHRDFINSVAFSPDGGLLASGGADGLVILWDVASGTPLQILRDHVGEVNTVAFSADGRFLASAGADTTIFVRNAATGQPLSVLKGQQGPIRTIAFSPDGNTLASSGEDTRILVWDATAGTLLKELTGIRSFVNALVFNRQGTLISGDESNQISAWDVATGQRPITITVPPAQANSATGGVPIAASLDPSTLTPHMSPISEPSAKGTTNAVWSTTLGRLLEWLIPAAEAAIPAPPGGPILIINSPASTFGNYYAEILRNEGLNTFAVADISTVTAATLASYDVVILATMPLSAAQVTMFSDWVNAGGNLIAMRPDKQLASLLGLTDAGATLANGYLGVDTSTAPGSGIVGQTIQFHGTADRYTLNGASSLATLYSNATTAISNPAVTLRSVGTNGGQAAAFTYDLATSIVYTRQGNPAWAAQERDGFSPIRSDDKFYGNATGDKKPDWIDLSKVAIPQADEQQRLLVNLILTMNLDKKPLPRFWYFPYGKKAVVIMTGDDHGNGGTTGRWDQFKAASLAGCSVAKWECVRGTSYVYPGTPLTDTQVAAYTAEGFEVGLHVNTNCADFNSLQNLEAFYVDQISAWTNDYPSAPPPITERHHCIAWSDWVTGARVQLSHGIRLDTDYYFWPPSWVADVPGMFTGSAMPMRFADLDGTLIDVYHAATQMTDESGQTYTDTVKTLLDRAIGPEGYYGAYTINAHTDADTTPQSDAVLAEAPPRDVPIVSSKQMLDWLDLRNSSSFGSLAWSGNVLSFTIVLGSGSPADGLQAMIPVASATGSLSSITRDGGNSVTYRTETIKGVNYAVFAAVAGSYSAAYTGAAKTLTSIAVTPVNPIIATGTTQQFTATGTYSDNSTQAITSQVTWTSSSTAVATITASGLATAVGAGATTISAALSSVTGSTTLTVQAQVTPLTIETTSLSDGTRGMAYSATLTARGGTPPYTWSIVSGSLPQGLTLLDSTGAISGTPNKVGTYSFTVQVSDKSNPGQTATKPLSIRIRPK